MNTDPLRLYTSIPSHLYTLSLSFVLTRPVRTTPKILFAELILFLTLLEFFAEGKLKPILSDWLSLRYYELGAYDPTSA
jgi:hypothetical protein